MPDPNPLDVRMPLDAAVKIGREPEHFLPHVVDCAARTMAAALDERNECPRSER